MDATAWVWLIGVIVFIVLEGVTYQIVSIWFAIGAAGGLIAKAAGADFTVQMIIFIAVSAVCLLCLRPVSKKFLKHKGEKTNAESLVGREVLITQSVDNLRGRGEGKVGGAVWTVRSADNSLIGEDETAIVERIEGVKLIVKKKGE